MAYPVQRAGRCFEVQCSFGFWCSSGTKHLGSVSILSEKMVNICVGDKEVLQVLNKNLLTLEGYSANISRAVSVLLRICIVNLVGNF